MIRIFGIYSAVIWSSGRIHDKLKVVSIEMDEKD